MFSNLRQRLILSQVLSLLMIILVIGFVLIYE